MVTCAGLLSQVRAENEDIFGPLNFQQVWFEVVDGHRRFLPTAAMARRVWPLVSPSSFARYFVLAGLVKDRKLSKDKISDEKASEKVSLQKLGLTRR